MVFAANQEKLKTYTFKDILLQLNKIGFLISMLKEVEAHETQNHWKIMKNIEVKNKNQNKYGKIKNIIYFFVI